MEADPVRLYEDVRQMMASMYPPESFGPEEVSKIPEGLDDHEKFKLERFIAEEKRRWASKTGCQDCETKFAEKAVTEGTHSGSGKLLICNWDRLVVTEAAPLLWCRHQKPLSSQQHDQIMVQVPKDELEIKKRNADIPEQSAKGMENMVETMAQSINVLG
eukprot:gene4495-5093_t